MTLKAVLYAASKLFVLVLPMDLGLALLGANKDPFLLAMLPLSPAVPHATLSIDLLCVGPGCIFRLAS